MKFQVERDVLAEAVGWSVRALPARPVIPVLAGLLLQAADGLTLSCFDYEVSARAEVDADVAEPGTVLVPGRLLAEITRSLPSLPVEFADDPDGVSLTCGSASFTLVTLPVEEYPDLPVLSLTAGTVDGGDLAAAVGQVAADRQEPPRDALRVGAGVPDVGELRRVAAGHRDHPGLARLQHPAAHLAADRADFPGHIDHGCFLRSCLPRASSVASASRCGVQNRRNCSSQSSTPRSGSGATA